MRLVLVMSSGGKVRGSVGGCSISVSGTGEVVEAVYSGVGEEVGCVRVSGGEEVRGSGGEE